MVEKELKEESNKKQKKEKWIIDTDPGCDDLVALIYLMNKEEAEIEFIALTEGNCKMHHVRENVKKTFFISDKKELTFTGAKHQLNPGALNAYSYHYEDGLGNIEEIKKIDTSKIEIESESKYSAVEIVRLVNKYPGEVNILTIGPLTNLALAFQLDSNLNKKVKNLIIMGGSYKEAGNTTSTAEFNFHHDYTAANLVFSRMSNILVCAWEPSQEICFNISDLEKCRSYAIEKFGRINEKVFSFVELIVKKYTL